MAILIIAMPFLGVAMMSSLTAYHWPLAIHRPIGIALPWRVKPGA
jgi:hypothetical protein